MKKVLVVGGAGYVGCVLVEELLNKGYSVRVLDRLFFGLRPIEHLLDRVEFIRDDMRELNEAHVDDCMAVINVGGLSNDPTAEFNPKANEEINTAATDPSSPRPRRRAASGGSSSPRPARSTTSASTPPGTSSATRSPRSTRAPPMRSPTTTPSGSCSTWPTTILPASSSGRARSTAGARACATTSWSTRSCATRSARALTVHCGGARCGGRSSTSRPRARLRHASRRPTRRCGGQIFNVVGENYRILELALRVREALRHVGVPVEIEVRLLLPEGPDLSRQREAPSTPARLDILR